MIAARQDPADRQLGGCHPAVGREPVEGIDQRQVAGPVLALEAGQGGAQIPLGQVREIAQHPAQRTAPHRREGDQRHAQLAGGIQEGDLDIARERRVFALHRRDRVDRMGPAQGLRAHLRQADPADLPLGHQVGHGADRILDRGREVAAVHVVEVDVIGLQRPQADFALSPDRFGPAIDPPLPVAVEDAHLRRDGKLVAAMAQPLADQFLAAPQAIEPGRVEVIVAQVQRALEHPPGLVPGQGRAIDGEHIHAPHRHGVDRLATERALDRHRSRQRSLMAPLGPSVRRGRPCRYTIRATAQRPAQGGTGRADTAARHHADCQTSQLYYFNIDVYYSYLPNIYCNSGSCRGA